MTATKATITVNLATGDHYFFSCHNDLYSSYAWASAHFTALCTDVAALTMKFPPTDNVDFVFKAAATTGTYVHVLDSGAFFNVTGSMEFRNIEFRGENALAAPKDPSLASFAHPPMATIPAKKCLISASEIPDGRHKPISFTTSIEVTNLNNLFDCSDTGFESASIPMNNNVTCT